MPGDDMKKKLRGSILLLLCTTVWGSAFVAQSVGMDHLGPFAFQTIRCFLAVLALLPVIWIADKSRKDGKNFFSRWADKELLKASLFCGVPLFLAANLQQLGLQYTDAGKAAFLTAMYIVLVPVIGLLWGRRPSPMVPFSVMLAVVGLYLLSCMGVSGVSRGDLYLWGCALMFAVQITFVDRFANKVDCLRLNCLQSLFVAVLSGIVTFFSETLTMQGVLDCWLPLCYAGILSMGLAYSLQIIGQRDLEASSAALLMSMESVFAVLSGWLILHETMTVWEALGSFLVFSSVILSQLPVSWKKLAKTTRNISSTDTSK